MIQPIRRYSVNGSTLQCDGHKIEVRTRADGTRFLFQESPTRKYLSGLKPKPELGNDVYQIDLLSPGGAREFYLLYIGRDVAILGTAKYNNSGSGHFFVRSDRKDLGSGVNP